MRRRWLLFSAAALALLTSAGARAQQKAGTPVIVSTEEACSIAVDGDDVGALPANGTRKLTLAAGEHIFTAQCPGGRRWREIVTVGATQKIVEIPAGAPAPAQSPAVGAVAAGARAGAALPAPPKGYTGIVNMRKGSIGGWLVLAVVKGGPAYRAGIRAGDWLRTVNGEDASKKSFEELAALDEGPIGSTLEGAFFAKGSLMKVTLTREALPDSGVLEVIVALDRVVERPYNASNLEAMARSDFGGGGGDLNWLVPGKAVGGQPTAGQYQVEDHCLEPGCNNAKAWNSMYCTAHKCADNLCANRRGYLGPYCDLHKCANPLCQNAKAWGSQYCTAHKPKYGY